MVMKDGDCFMKLYFDKLVRQNFRFGRMQGCFNVK